MVLKGCIWPTNCMCETENRNRKYYLNTYKYTAVQIKSLTNGHMMSPGSPYFCNGTIFPNS